MRPLVLIMCLVITRYVDAQMYFPPNTGNSWETTDPSELGFCQENIDSLYAYLLEKNSRSFMLLKDGRIVLEQYAPGVGQGDLWYWASCGKSLTAYLVGAAQDQDLMDIQLPTSTYLGEGWTVAPPEKEIEITPFHQLSMTTGLADNDDLNCLDPECLEYFVDVGERWSYFSQGSRLLNDVLEEVTDQGLNALTDDLIGDAIGMDGFWLAYVMWSTARDMARFGLLALNEGIWDGDTLLHDLDYLQAMTSPSQALNPAYGLLWWLNGQDSYLLPGLDLSIPGQLIPSAPEDMFCALGLNDQKIYVVPSQGLVVVRQGDAAGDVFPGPSGFDTELWELISALECEPTSTIDRVIPTWSIGPNPVEEQLTIRGIQEGIFRILDIRGRELMIGSIRNNTLISTTHLEKGTYLLEVVSDGNREVKRFVH